MTDSNTRPNANTNGDMTNQSSNDDEQSSMATNQTGIVSESGHHDSGIGTVQSSTLPTDNRPRFRLGHTQPPLLAYTPGLNQGGQGARRIAHPSDEEQSLEITFIFSSSVEIYRPLPQESSGVEDTQPHDMPIPLILHNIRREPITNDESNHSHDDARAHNNPSVTTNLMSHNELNSRTIERNDTTTTAPMEDLHDTDFSVDTFDPHSGNQSDADSEEDEERIVSENLHTIGSDNNLPDTNEGQASSNPDAVNLNNENTTTWSNQTNIIIDEPVATNASSPQPLDNERNVNIPTGGVYQSGVHVIPSLNIFMPKERSPVDSGDESSGESTA